MNNINNEPLFTVVIPAKNEATGLPLAVGALDSERTKHGLIGDIIVVDNFSSDDTLKVAESLPCRAIQCDGSVGKVRNMGAQRANTPYLVFVDADVIVSTDWSQQIAKTIYNRDTLKPNENIICGSTLDIPKDANWLERTWFHSLTSRKDHRYINGGHLVIDRSLFNRVEGFQPGLDSGEDIDLCRRATRAGGILTYNEEIHAVHLGYPKTLSHFIKREVWHGREMIKDIRHPLGNNALMLALVHLALILMLMFSALLSRQYFLPIMVTYPLLPLGLSLLRLRVMKYPDTFQLAFLLSLYGFARAWALAKSLLYRS